MKRPIQIPQNPNNGNNVRPSGDGMGKYAQEHSSMRSKPKPDDGTFIKIHRATHEIRLKLDPVKYDEHTRRNYFYLHAYIFDTRLYDDRAPVRAELDTEVFAEAIPGREEEQFDDLVQQLLRYFGDTMEFLSLGNYMIVELKVPERGLYNKLLKSVEELLVCYVKMKYKEGLGHRERSMMSNRGRQDQYSRGGRDSYMDEGQGNPYRGRRDSPDNYDNRGDGDYRNSADNRYNDEPPMHLYQRHEQREDDNRPARYQQPLYQQYEPEDNQRRSLPSGVRDQVHRHRGSSTMRPVDRPRHQDDGYRGQSEQQAPWQYQAEQQMQEQQQQQQPPPQRMTARRPIATGPPAEVDHRKIQAGNPLMANRYYNRMETEQQSGDQPMEHDGENPYSPQEQPQQHQQQQQHPQQYPPVQKATQAQQWEMWKQQQQQPVKQQSRKTDPEEPQQNAQRDLNPLRDFDQQGVQPPPKWHSSAAAEVAQPSDNPYQLEFQFFKSVNRPT